MAEKPAEFPRIALHQHRLSQIKINARYPLSPEQAERFRALSGEGGPPSRLFDGHAVYTQKGHRYEISAHVRVYGRSNFIRLELEYEETTQESFRRTKEHREREAGLIRELDALGAPDFGVIRFLFAFNQDAVADLWFPIPTRVEESRDRVFAIEAISAARLSEDEATQPQYRFTLSTGTNNDEVFCHVSKLIDWAITPSSILTAIDAAKKIASELVTPKEGMV